MNLVGEAAQAQGASEAAAPTDAEATVTPAAEEGASAKAGAADGAASKKAAVVSAESGDWNEEQEAMLVKAMKEFGKELSDR